MRPSRLFAIDSVECLVEEAHDCQENVLVDRKYNAQLSVLEQDHSETGKSAHQANKSDHIRGNALHEKQVMLDA